MGNTQSENSSRANEANGAAAVSAADNVMEAAAPITTDDALNNKQGDSRSITRTSVKDEKDDKDETNKEKERNPSFLQRAIQDLFRPDNEPEPPVIRRPKHMLWGCETPEEHYETIADVCARTATLEGEEGLRELGFEFRMIHHAETCDCEDVSSNCVTFDENGNDYGFMDGNDTVEQQQEFLAPIGVPLDELHRGSLERSMTDLVENTIDRLAHQENMVDSSPSSSDARSSSIPKRGSNVSLFSLATHYTASTTSVSTNQQSSSAPPAAITYNGIGGAEEDKTCDLRLHHIPSGGTLVTPENHQQFIAHGQMYDEIARLCMEKAQDVMMEEARLEWVSVCDARGIEALVSKPLPPPPSKVATPRKVLLIVTGKGQVRAGIFSRRHLMTTGMETSTALPLIREALQRDMEIIMLDPNAKGHTRGMEVVEASLEKLFFHDGRDDDEEIYVVAHSMAGAQLVRFLHKHESSLLAPASGGDSQEGAASNEGEASPDNDARCALSDNGAQSFLCKIKAVAFTDSNHNINWTRDTPSVKNLLVSPSCLYIKSHKIHDDPKQLGEPHHHCDFWRHRFGDIKTMWAGTHEHALTNYTARFHIWDHFDEFLHPERGENGDSDEEFQTYYGAEGLIE